MEISGIRLDTGAIVKETAEKAAAEIKNPGAQLANITEALLADAKVMPKLNAEALKEALISYGLNPTQENIELMVKLLENSMPSDKQTVMKLNQALKLFNITESKIPVETSNLEKAVFTVKNQLPVSNKAIDKLNNFLGEGKSITRNLQIIEAELEKAIPNETVKNIIDLFTDNITDETESNELNTKLLQEPLKKEEVVELSANIKPEQKEELREIIKQLPTTVQYEDAKKLLSKTEEIINPEKTLKTTDYEFIAKELFINEPEIKDAFTKACKAIAEKESQVPTKAKITSKFALEPEENNLEKLEEKLTQLKQKTEEALSIFEKAGEKPSEQLIKAFEDLRDNLDFMNSLKTCAYIPIPLNLQEGHTEAELYVFKDGKSKKKSGASSALIALNTVSLKRIEAYVQKHESSLNIQFRIEDIEVSKIIKANSLKLIELMDRASLKITAMSITELDKPFNIVQKEPDSREKEIGLHETVFDLKA